MSIKYIWFFGCLFLAIKGAVLTYAAATGMIDGVEIQHTIAAAIATAFMDIGVYLLWPWKKN